MDSQGLRPKKTKRKGVPTISLHTRSNAYFYNLPHHKILSQMWIIHHRHNLKSRRPKSSPSTRNFHCAGCEFVRHPEEGRSFSGRWLGPAGAQIFGR
uniref:Uncharacterized protein n=1 Tax=Coccidioides posadasii RMSCC 3488 TaxID=454284 RepID=A0A0J6FS65_COCPO|nr:hypothetical protein CPAG_08209 [Coccidioides posadasii RMSCC 3488]